MTYLQKFLTFAGATLALLLVTAIIQAVISYRHERTETQDHQADRYRDPIDY